MFVYLIKGPRRHRRRLKMNLLILRIPHLHRLIHRRRLHHHLGLWSLMVFWVQFLVLVFPWQPVLKKRGQQ